MRFLCRLSHNYLNYNIYLKSILFLIKNLKNATIEFEMEDGDYIYEPQNQFLKIKTSILLLFIIIL